MIINTVTVIGSNGTLGTGVGAIFASFGNAKVYMVARNMEKAKDSIEKAALSVRANAICENMIPKTYDDLSFCIKQSDLVIETVIESYDTKKIIHTEINKYLKNTSITSSVTSGISINKLANCYDLEKRKNFFGIHFFNPPYNLQLCELIASNYSDENIEDSLEKYLSAKLYRKVIRTKDKAGFLANRIGFQFINKAMQYAEKYSEHGGIDYIDNILGCFTGRNMNPLCTADFVGLDIHKAIVDNIYENTNDIAHETFKLPKYINDLINDGMIGDKVNKGLYLKDANMVYDIDKKEYIQRKEYNIKFINKVIEQLRVGEYKNSINVIMKDNSIEAEICRKMLIDYIIYSYVASKEVGYNLIDADTAMAEGFNWIPPFALLDLIGKKDFIEKSIEYYPKCEKEINDLVGIDIKSKYRYEKFLKAKR